MLYRTRPRRRLTSKLIWRALDIVIAASGLYMLYLAASGIWHGEVPVFSKRVSGTLSWAQDPLWFVGTTVAWVSGGVFFLRLAVREK